MVQKSVVNKVQNNPSLPTIKVKDQEIQVEIAQTLEQQQQGLSGRESIESDRGMLFVYNEPANYKFWMKDMKFEIDIIWIDKGKVVGITDNVPVPSPNTPLNKLPSYASPQPVTAVLEVQAGFTATHNIMVGDTVEINNLEPSL